MSALEITTFMITVLPTCCCSYGTSSRTGLCMWHLTSVYGMVWYVLWFVLKEWNAWRKSGKRPANMPSTPQRTYKHEGLARIRALAGHWYNCSQRQAVPVVQESAAARTLPQAERSKGVGGVVQERRTSCQHALTP